MRLNKIAILFFILTLGIYAPKVQAAIGDYSVDLDTYMNGNCNGYPNFTMDPVDINRECLNDIGGNKQRRLCSQGDYTFESMTTATGMRLNNQHGDAYGDYVYSQCRSQTPQSYYRWRIWVDKFDPFNPSVGVELKSTHRDWLFGINKCSSKRNCIDFFFYKACWSCNSNKWNYQGANFFDINDMLPVDDTSGSGLQAYTANMALGPIPMGACVRQVYTAGGASDGIIPPSTIFQDWMVPDVDDYKNYPYVDNVNKSGTRYNDSGFIKACAFIRDPTPSVGTMLKNPYVQSAIVGAVAVSSGGVGGAVVATVAMGAASAALPSTDNRCNNNWGGKDSARLFIGCVDLPMKPPPPVFNPVYIASIKAVIDSAIAYQTSPAKLPPMSSAVQTAVNQSMRWGSTFDQPVIQIVTGASSQLQFPPTDTSNQSYFNVLKLRHIFPNDKEVIDPSMSNCGIMPHTGVKYCTLYDPTTPYKICACVPDDPAGTDCYQSACTASKTTGCCTNYDRTTCPTVTNKVGCAVRPTPNQSSINYYINQTTILQPSLMAPSSTLRGSSQYPALQVNFQASKTPNSFGTTQNPNGAYDRAIKIHNIWINARTLQSVDSSTIQPYTLNAALQNDPSRTIPEFVFNAKSNNDPAASASGQTDNCLILTNSTGNNPGNYDYYRNFDAYDNVPLTFDNTGNSSTYNISSCTYAPNNTKMLYGINFTTTIPDYSADNNIKQTQIITPANVLPAGSFAVDNLTKSLTCHKINNANTAIKSWITADDFNKGCYAADVASITATSTTLPLGMSLNYPVMTVPANQSDRKFGGICNMGILESMNTLYPNTALLRSDRYRALESNSDAEAIGTLCPGIMDESTFEDLDSSRICLSYPMGPWNDLSLEIIGNLLNPNLGLRTCILGAQKVCPAYKTPSTESDMTNWSRPMPQGSVLASTTNGMCQSTSGVEARNLITNVSVNFNGRHANYLEKSGYNYIGHDAYCSSFPGKLTYTIPTMTVASPPGCAGPGSFTFTIDKLNYDYISGLAQQCSNYQKLDTNSWMLSILETQASTFQIDISQDLAPITDTINSGNAQQSLTLNFQPNALINCTAQYCTANNAKTYEFNRTTNLNMNCFSTGCNSGCAWKCYNAGYQFIYRRWNGNDNYCLKKTDDVVETEDFGCNTQIVDQTNYSQPFTYNPASFDQNALNNFIANFQSMLVANVHNTPINTYVTKQRYYVGIKAQDCSGVFGNDQWCWDNGGVCNDLVNPDRNTRQSYQQDMTVLYQCPYDYRSAAQGAIDAFENQITGTGGNSTSNMTLYQGAIASQKVIAINSISKKVQNQIAQNQANAARLCNQYYAAYYESVTSVDATEMCGRIASNGQLLTDAQIIQLYTACVNQGGGYNNQCGSLAGGFGSLMTPSMCNQIINDNNAKSPTSCNPATNPLNCFLFFKDGLVNIASLFAGIPDQLNKFITSNQTITLADGASITGAYTNLVNGQANTITKGDGSVVANPSYVNATSNTYSFGQYLAARLIAGDGLVINPSNIFLQSTQIVPTRKCDYTANQKGCKNSAGVDTCTINAKITPTQTTPQVIQSTCVKKSGCGAITTIADFTGYATWPSITSVPLSNSFNSPAQISVAGKCAIPGVSISPAPQIKCNVLYNQATNSYFYYWDDINPNDPGIAACIAAGKNYW